MKRETTYRTFQQEEGDKEHKGENDFTQPQTTWQHKGKRMMRTKMAKEWQKMKGGTEKFQKGGNQQRN